jgi:FAD/FMN-containing dehydrogenase
MSTQLQQLVIKGTVLNPGDAAYDAERKVWNGMIDRKPALLAQCKDADDISACVKFARKNNLVVSIRGGGHNVAGNAVCDGGLMIDLSKMKAIHVDILNKTVTAEPGVILREFDAATMQHGLATTMGTVSETGIAGLTLGGGIGYLMSKFGTASDNLISAEMVMADGEQIKVDKDNHADLYWAIRGGGGNFGIVSKFEYQLHKFGPNVVGGMILYSMDQGKAAMQNYRNYTRTAPDDLMAYSGFITTPDGLPVTAIVPVWVGDVKVAEKYLAPLRSYGTPIADMVTEMPYVQMQALLDAAAPTGIRRYWKSGYFTDLTDELLDIALKHVANRPSPLSPVLFFHLRGAAVKTPVESSAFGNRRDQWDSDIISQWIDPADDEKNISWTRNFWNEIAPLTNGVYVNHLGSDDDPRIANAFGSNFDKLKAIKKKYDPDNFFRMNNNIKPA